MAGMMTQDPGAQSPPAPPPQAPPMASAQGDTGQPETGPTGDQGPNDPQDQQPNVSPEEQKQYDEFVGNGLKLIYDEKTLPSVIQRLKGGGDPIEGLSSAASTIVLRLQDSAEHNGTKLDSDVLFQGGIELLQELATLSQHAGIHTYTPKEVEGALYRALDQYRTVQQQRGAIHQDAAKQDLNQIQQADQSGQLEQQFPGLKQHFAAENAQARQAAQSQAQPQPQQQAQGMLPAGPGGA